MPVSRLTKAAERLRIVANTLNDPADRAVASAYVEDLERLAGREVKVTPPAPSAAKDVRVSTLSGTLSMAFPVTGAEKFDPLIRALNR